MENKKGQGLIIILLVILAVLVVWGLVGASEAKDVGTTCDMGMGDTFCWKWHTNTIGEFQEGFDNFGNDEDYGNN